MTEEQEIQAGLAEAFKGSPINNEGQEFLNIVAPNAVITDKVEVVSEKAETVEPEKIVDVEKTLIRDNDVVDNKEPITKTKSFEEEFSERFGGKFKSVEEVLDLLNAPKEELDDEIKHLAQLKKQGVKFDTTFWEVQTKDYEGMKDPMQILAESMKLKPEFKGWSDEEIKFELKSKYRFSEWSEEGEEPSEVQTIMSKRMVRDSENEKQWLIDKKNSYINFNKPDEKEVLAQQEQARQAQLNWEKFVDEELFNKVNKLSTKIDENESFDFDVSESDRKDAANIMKQMPKDINVFWNQFKDATGQFDQKKVYETILWLKNKDNAIKILHQNAKAKGAEAEIKAIKNISFKANEGSTTDKVDWRIKAQQQIEQQL